MSLKFVYAHFTLIEGNVFIVEDIYGELVISDSVDRWTTLSVDISDVNTAQLDYEWIVNDKVVSTDSSYTVTDQYLGSDIYVRVTGAGIYYGTLTTQNVRMNKVERHLEAPIVASKISDNTILIQKMFHVGDDTLEYGYATIDDSSAVVKWQSSNELVLPDHGEYYLFVKATGSDVYVDAISNGTKYLYVDRGELSGTVSSFGSEKDEIFVYLFREGQSDPIDQIVVTGNSAEYIFKNVEFGTYILKVIKNNHAAGEFEVIVQEPVVDYDVTISIMADINLDGKFNLLDLFALKSYIAGQIELTAQQLNIADVDKDGKTNISDLFMLKKFIIA